MACNLLKHGKAIDLFLFFFLSFIYTIIYFSAWIFTAIYTFVHGFNNVLKSNSSRHKYSNTLSLQDKTRSNFTRVSFFGIIALNMLFYDWSHDHTVHIIYALIWNSSRFIGSACQFHSPSLPTKKKKKIRPIDYSHHLNIYKEFPLALTDVMDYASHYRSHQLWLWAEITLSVGPPSLALMLYKAHIWIKKKKKKSN